MREVAARTRDSREVREDIADGGVARDFRERLQRLLEDDAYPRQPGRAAPPHVGDVER